MNLTFAPRGKQSVDALPRLGEQQRSETTGDVVDHETEWLRTEALCQLLGRVEAITKSAAVSPDPGRGDPEHVAQEKISGKHEGRRDDRRPVDSSQSGGGAANSRYPHHCAGFDHRQTER